MDHWYGKDAYHYVELFEQEFAKYIGRKYCLMTPNATSAIHLIIKSLGIGDGDEVVAPNLTWIASVAPLVYERAIPAFADVEMDNWCVSRQTVNEMVSTKTKAVIAVDLHGNMPDMAQLEAYCAEKGLYLIEDSAQAIGSKLDGRNAGTFGIASVFSFHRTKTLVTGEGGVLVTDNDRLYETAKMYRDHGRVVGDIPYWNRVVGYKYMPSNILAAIAYGQLTRIEELIAKKRHIFNYYREHIPAFKGVAMNQDDERVFNGAWVTGLTWDERYKIDKVTFMKKLQENEVPPRPFFYPLTDLTAFRDVTHVHSVTPNAHYLSQHGINLPCALDLDDEQLDHISTVVTRILGDSCA